ncbi:DUF3822 family protein [Flavobacterium sp. GCM10023249]|uniref:DUF3822 family protein n=1 Tax=unclassified Flavobacterium TaxID=196869 RepID=UPI003612E651
MHTASTNILDKKYSKLLLQISLSEISFCIVDTLTDKIETFGDLPLDQSANFVEIENKIIDFIKNTAVLQSNFDNVVVLYNNNLNTFVPQVLFDEAYLGSYLQYNVKVFENDFIAYDEIANYEMNNVYIPYANINNALMDIYGNFNYKHSYSILVKKLLDLSKNIDETQAFVHCQKDNFQLIVIKNQKLLLFNSFDFKSKEDFIYYLLFTFEQLQLNPETLPLKLFGSISKEHDIYQIAYKYIRNVSLFIDHNDLEQKITQQNYLQHFILIHGCE